MERRMPSRPRSRSRRTFDERTMRIALLLIGGFHLLLGLYEFLLPGSFFHRIGEYGEENTHYVGDVGAFTLAFGIVCLVAAGRPMWRPAVLYLGAVWYAIHAFNHLLDVGEAANRAVGAFQVLLLAAGAALLAWLGGAASAASPVPRARIVDYERDR